jgi:hypothetical protein
VARRQRPQSAGLADKEFPGEEWIFVENDIYLSPRRLIGAKSNYKDELLDARILRYLGSTVYLCPENRYIAGRKYDAIVAGQKTEFKNVGGNANTLENQLMTVGGCHCLRCSNPQKVIQWRMGNDERLF